MFGVDSWPFIGSFLCSDHTEEPPTCYHYFSFGPFRRLGLASYLRRKRSTCLIILCPLELNSNSYIGHFGILSTNFLRSGPPRTR